MSSLFSWTYLSISNWCLLSSVDISFAPETDVLYLHLNLPLYLELTSSFFSWSYPSISNWYLLSSVELNSVSRIGLLSSVELTSVSQIHVFFRQLNFPLYLELMSSFFVWSYFSIMNRYLLSSVEVTFLFRIYVFYLQLNLPLSRVDNFFLQLILLLYLELMSSFFGWTHLCILSWCIVSSVELTFVSRINVFFPQLILPLHLELMYSVEISPVSRIGTLVPRIDVFFHLLNSPLYLELTSPFLYWTYLCILNLCPNFFSWTYLCISSMFLSSKELTSVSRVDVFLLQWNLPMYLELMSSFFRWTHLCNSNWCILSSVEVAIVSWFDLFFL